MFRGSSEPVETIGVASLNMLLDKTRSAYTIDHPEYIEPQYQRVESLARTLGSLPVALNVVMLQELHITTKHHNGEYLQEALGLEQGFWFNHNTNSRKNEYLGVMGDTIDDVYEFNIGDNRKAVVAVVKETAFVNIHHRSGRLKTEIRVAQTQRVLDEVAPFKKAVIIGDSNSHSKELPRKMLSEAGFTSAYRMKGVLPGIPGMLPTTFPTNNYNRLRLSNNHIKIPGAGLSLDVIELRGFERRDVIRAGTVMTQKSDHKTMYGELAA